MANGNFGDDWDKDSKGNIKVKPLEKFACAAFPNPEGGYPGAVLIRMKIGSKFHQVALAADFALRFADQLAHAGITAQGPPNMPKDVH